MITDVKTDERRNVIIDFATVEFYPGGVPSLPTDTAARDWLNAVIAAKTEEKPKFTFWDWLYLAVVGVVSVAALIFIVRVVARIRKQLRNRKSN